MYPRYAPPGPNSNKPSPVAVPFIVLQQRWLI
jgi:hypothetical protein